LKNFSKKKKKKKKFKKTSTRSTPLHKKKKKKKKKKTTYLTYEDATGENYFAPPTSYLRETKHTAHTTRPFQYFTEDIYEIITN